MPRAAGCARSGGSRSPRHGSRLRASPRPEGRPCPDPRPSRLPVAQRGRLLPRGALATCGVGCFSVAVPRGPEAWHWLCSRGNRRSREGHTRFRVSPRDARPQARATSKCRRAVATGVSCFVADGAAVPWTRLAAGTRSACPSETLRGGGHLEDVGQRAPRFSLCRGDPCTCSGHLAGPTWTGLLSVVRRGCQHAVTGPQDDKLPRSRYQSSDSPLHGPSRWA